MHNSALHLCCHLAIGGGGENDSSSHKSQLKLAETWLDFSLKASFTWLSRLDLPHDQRSKIWLSQFTMYDIMSQNQGIIHVAMWSLRENISQTGISNMVDRFSQPIEANMTTAKSWELGHGELLEKGSQLKLEPYLKNYKIHQYHPIKGFSGIFSPNLASVWG